MRVAIIGAGNVGVAQAYELATEGHTVTVFEQRGSIAAEASFAHAGLAVPGALTPWATPRLASPSLVSLFNRKALVGIEPSLAAWRWARRSQRANKPRHAPSLLARQTRLLDFSQQRLRAWTLALKLDHERADGCLVLVRDGKAAERMQQRLTALEALGIRAQWLTPEACRITEPGLNPEAALAGGVLLPQAEVSNARQFALLMRNEAQRLGVRFLMHTVVQHIEPGPRPRLTHLAVDVSAESTLATTGSDGASGGAPAAPQTDTFDAIVVCAGTHAATLLAPLGTKLPIMAVHGWSLTAPLRHHEAHPEAGPRAALIDERHQVSLCRIGNRVRVSGGARIGGTARSSELPERLHQSLHDWFPGVAHLSQAQRWTGARACTPDGLPMIGPTGLQGVWINAGHGSGGWAFAAGSARLLADALGQRLPSIDPEGLGADRWRS